jgi:MFS family permease
MALTAILGVPLTKVSELSGYQLLIVGALGPLVSVLAQKYGKRPQFLFASTMGAVGTIICCAAGTNYHTLLAGRMVQGLGVTAFESLSVAAIGDMFYMHERGWRTAGIVLTLACMASMVSIISGPISQQLGWQYLFYIALPFDIVGLIATFLFVPETQFRRDEHKEMMLQHHEANGGSVETEIRGEKEVDVSVKEAGLGSAMPRMSFAQSLRVFSGTYAQENIFHLLFEIFIHLLNPAVIWIQLVSAVLVVSPLHSITLEIQSAC